MSDHHDEPIDQNLLEEMGYEPRDINIKTITTSIAAFIAVSAVIMFFGLFLMWWVMPQGTGRVPAERVAPRKLMPPKDTPLIQSNATALEDQIRFAREQRAALTSYAWTDRKKGFVRVPVEQALNAVVAEGLPSRPGARAVGGLPR